MSFEKVKSYFDEQGIGDKVLQFERSSATVALAAAAVGCEPAKIAKTMSFYVDEAPVLIVTAGDTKVDNKKFKAHFHQKAKMITYDEVEAETGHAPGGVCPFVLKEGIKVYLDESLKRFDVIYPAAGSSNSAVKLTIDEIQKHTGYMEWIDVCKIIEMD